MSPAVIAIAVFVIIMVFVGVLYRKSTLDQLAPLPGEETQFEEAGIRVTTEGSPRTSLFLSCRVRITNKRLIVAQKALLSKTHVLRYVVFLNQSVEGTDLGETMKKGYIVSSLSRTDITLQERDGRTLVHFPLKGSALTSRQFVLIRTGKPDEFMTALGR